MISLKMNKKFTSISIHGIIYGLLSFGISVLTHLIGVLLHPNYDMMEMAISVLGDGNGGIIYRIGLVITGLIGIPFCVYLANLFKKKGLGENARKAVIKEYSWEE